MTVLDDVVSKLIRVFELSVQSFSYHSYSDVIKFNRCDVSVMKWNEGWMNEMEDDLVFLALPLFAQNLQLVWHRTLDLCATIYDSVYARHFVLYICHQNNKLKSNQIFDLEQA